jgi:hypothetical protein
MDDTGRLRCNETVSVNVGHDIVAPALLLESGRSKLIVLDALVVLQLSNGLLRDVKTKLTLRLGEVDPKLSPGAETVARRKDVLHLLGGVPRVEGADAWVSIEPARHMPGVSKRHFLSRFGRNPLSLSLSVQTYFAYVSRADDILMYGVATIVLIGGTG